MVKTLINGKAEETVNVNDRGLQYGDGLFETMAVRSNKVTLWQEHWQRLVLGSERLSIRLPDKKVVEEEIEQLCREESKQQFVIKLIITRGEGERGYRFTESQNVTRILSLHRWPNYTESYQEKGVSVCYCETILSENAKLAGIKHLNRLEQVLARNEWKTNKFQEGLMLTINGNVVDGTMSNIFMVKDNILFTPDLSLCGVLGVMRNMVIQIAKELGFVVNVEELTKRDIEMADELFLTNNIFGIWPVKVISEKRFTCVGDITRQLQKELKIRLL